MDGNKRCLQPWKKGLDMKTPLTIFIMQMHRRKVIFKKTSQTWAHFPQTFSQFFFQIYFLRDFNSCDLIFSDLLYCRKKSHRNLKLQDFTSSDIFFQGLEKIRIFSKVFYFQVFFPVTFFPGTFLHRFLKFVVQYKF